VVSALLLLNSVQGQIDGEQSAFSRTVAVHGDAAVMHFDEMMYNRQP
jgi:hypothetical protein